MNIKRKAFILFVACIVTICCQRKESNINKVSTKFIEGNHTFPEVQERHLPISDSTNFDNFKFRDSLLRKEIEIMSLYSLEYSENATFYLNYKLHISNNFSTYVVSYLPNDQELYTVIINYSPGGKIISYKTIAYDEIAESFIRQYSTINQKDISMIKTNAAQGETEITKSNYSFRSNGKIE